jgi:hypothetical protein
VIFGEPVRGKASGRSGDRPPVVPLPLVPPADKDKKKAPPKPPPAPPPEHRDR